MFERKKCVKRSMISIPISLKKFNQIFKKVMCSFPQSSPIHFKIYCNLALTPLASLHHLFLSPTCFFFTFVSSLYYSFNKSLFSIMCRTLFQMLGIHIIYTMDKIKFLHPLCLVGSMPQYSGVKYSAKWCSCYQFCTV